MINSCVLFKTLVNVISSLNHTTSPFLMPFPPCLFLDASHILTSLYSSPFLLFLLFYSFTLPCLSLPSLLPCLFSSLCTARPPPSSAHVDMSTVAFDVDTLDLDAEEPPESQGDPRSPKAMSGSVTSPQANAHRLPFFKKVTLGAQDTSLTSPASLLHLSPTPHTMWSGLISSLLSLTAHN